MKDKPEHPYIEVRFLHLKKISKNREPLKQNGQDCLSEEVVFGAEI